MFFVFLFFLSVFILYFVVISLFIAGFIRLKSFDFNSKNLNGEVYVSVIVPARNEKDNIENLLTGLRNQSLSKNLFEVITVDDNSSDGTFETAKRFSSGFDNFKLVKSEKQGKKGALITGVNISSGELIVFTDADCLHNVFWLENIYKFYLRYKPKMIIAPVIMTGETFFQKLQAAEFFSLTASTAGAAGIKKPIMCNGANLAFEKSVFFEFDDILNEKEVSGDDVFLLHNIKKKYPDGVLYLKSNDAVVYTKAEKDFKSFLKQRLRWVSKSRSYKDFDTVFVALTVFLTNIVFIVSFPAMFIYKNYAFYFLILFFLKFIPDFMFFLISSVFFKQKKLLLYFLLIFLPYPFYGVFLGFSGLFGIKR